MMTKRNENSVYQKVTDNIIEKLEQGVIPWRKPWKGFEAPKNLITKKEYRGINIFLLAFQGYGSPYWLTYKQAKELGGSVMKGQKSTEIVFWKPMEIEEQDDNGEKKKKKILLLRYYNVFNVEQCENLDESKIPQINMLNPDFNAIESCEKTIENMPNRPKIIHEGGRAVYNSLRDDVKMPKKETFIDEEHYYSVLFHELGHSTGHETRLNRKDFTGNYFGSESYSKEELVAEMTAAFLCSVNEISMPTIENSAAYIKSWLKKLKDDVKMVVFAAAQAQKAADYILNVE